MKTTVSDYLVIIWANAGFGGNNFAQILQQLWCAEVEAIDHTFPSFRVLPKRWIVERIFGWWN